MWTPVGRILGSKFGVNLAKCSKGCINNHPEISVYLLTDDHGQENGFGNPAGDKVVILWLTCEQGQLGHETMSSKAK